MPNFQQLPVEEAMAKSSAKSGTAQPEVTQEYLSYCTQLKEGSGGRLQSTGSESIRTVRKRLAAASKLARRELVMKQVGNELYFWLKAPGREHLSEQLTGLYLAFGLMLVLGLWLAVQSAADRVVQVFSP